MFYDAVARAHGLKHDPFKALVSPRPIGWIGSKSASGKCNLAPYSFFNAFSSYPHIVGFSTEGYKDSIANIEATGVFSCSMAVWDLREQMNITSAAVGPEVDEFELAGLTPVQCELIDAPRVGESPVALECRYQKTVSFDPVGGHAVTAKLVIGEVIGIHIDDRLIADGMVDITRARPLARLGYKDYSVVNEVFQMTRPGEA
ncbi:MAG: flavin reductase family protein [Rhodobiaceae bacterium]|nr:flavin reductase family protein [Rhodobiaceae bacterium]MCC0016973.1 flavin reductase family protein [Rhodobiaceae bacterium]MCC0042349.1 flavin reductase family protein [Rhodobiaceae bacterium]MCC0054123.1 flavin reductase family protein [Rhodobiaceae bacterium]